MKKFKLIMISSLLMVAGITAFAAKTNNKKLEKKISCIYWSNKGKMYELKK